MRVFVVSAFVLLSSVAANAVAADVDTAIGTYKSGDYARALPLLQAAVASAPRDEALNAALLSSLVYLGQVDAASEATISDAKAFPNSPAVISARGEFAYYMGDMEKAENLFRAAIKLQEPTPRAYLGLGRLYQAAAMHHLARLLILRAHEIDPDDALITRNWLSFVPPAKQEELFIPFEESHPWFFKNIHIHRATSAEITEELKQRTIFQPEEKATETFLSLVPIYGARQQIEAVGLSFQLNNGRALTLILDTGASGVTLNHRAADTADLNHLGSLHLGGIGDQKDKTGFAAISDTCRIGTLRYKTCLISAVEENMHFGEGEDGLIGTDVFSNYLVEIDFLRYKLRLTPLPSREPNQQGYDSSGPGNGWTRMFQYGHLLFVPTDLNGKTSGLFLIDTGATISNVDSTFARLSTKLHNNSYMRVRGLSGDVNEVFEASKAVITFAGYRQKNVGLTSFNLNNSPEHRDVRIDGLLGFSVLDLFRLTLDYRNGLVKFEYARK